MYVYGILYPTCKRRLGETMRLLALFSASSLITALMVTGDVTFLLGNLGVLAGASCLMLATVTLQKA